jgi:chemotaxis regulatin CheY-phosphate phosphatase CheZ
MIQPHINADITIVHENGSGTMRQPVEEPDREQRFYANGVGSVTRKLRDAIQQTTGHNFEEAISEVEDALDDLETLEEGPDTDDD